MQIANCLTGEAEITSSATAWYALYTRHQHEKTVAHALSGKGFEVFLPLYCTAHRWQDRVRRLSLPLFPGYVFIRTGLKQRFPALTTPGVHHFVPTAERPIPIPEGEIEGVRQLALNTAQAEPHPFLRCGDWVRVKGGPLEGLEGILTRRKSGYRLVLSVELLQQSVAVEVEAWNVESIRARWGPAAAIRSAS